MEPESPLPDGMCGALKVRTESDGRRESRNHEEGNRFTQNTLCGTPGNDALLHGCITRCDAVRRGLGVPLIANIQAAAARKHTVPIPPRAPAPAGVADGGANGRGILRVQRP